MQQLRVTPTWQYAGLGARFLAVIIDTFCVGGLFVIVLMAASAAGAFDVSTYEGKNPWNVTVPTWAYVALYGLLFVYYAAFELARGATPGKILLGMRVTAADGTRAAPAAIVMRNLVRIPEAIFYYIPSAISWMATAKRQRLGDLAGRTVVVRLAALAPPRSGPAGGRARPAAPAPPAFGPAPGPPAAPADAVSSPAIYAGPDTDPVATSLDALKAAALTLRGAHYNYLRLSEREIERGGGVTAEFSPEYAAAWHTLADAVIALQHANTDAARASAAAGMTLQDAAARRPDLLNLCRELEPYFSAGSDDQVHAAYLNVARRESAGG